MTVGSARGGGGGTDSSGGSGNLEIRKAEISGKQDAVRRLHTHEMEQMDPNWVKIHNTAENMLYKAWMIIVSGRHIKKLSFGSFDF